MNYEYKVLLFREPAVIMEAELNKAGAEGFKIVAVTERFDSEGNAMGDTVYLMREVTSNP